MFSLVINFYAKDMNLKQFKYWLRINRFHPKQFGTGERRNPIRLRYKQNNSKRHE